MPRHSYWVDTLVDMNIASGSRAMIRLGSLDLVFLDSRTATVIRTIVDLWLVSATVAGAWGASEDWYGVGVTPSQAFNAGVANVADPFIQDEHPTHGWLLKSMCVSSQNGTGTPVAVHCHADIRAMRKVENGVVFLTVAYEPMVGMAFPLEVRGLIRLLVKE